jgi:ribosome-binding protein aMBF1 (putative translation factor)
MSDMLARMEKKALNQRIAVLVQTARLRAGLTQVELAERARTRQPVIARFEDPHYEGHSLSMLQRIAAALDLKVEVRLIARPTRTPTSPRRSRKKPA